MANEIKSAMAAFATVVDAVSGVDVATSEPKELKPEGVSALVFLFDGTVQIGPIGTKKSLLTFAIDLLKARKDLPRDLATLNPFLNSIPLALVTEVSDGGGLFSSTIETFRDIRMQLLPSVDYGGVQCIGYRFLVGGVKILVDL